MQIDIHSGRRRAVFFCCLDPAADPFGWRVWARLTAVLPVIALDDEGVMIAPASDRAGNELCFVGVRHFVHGGHAELLPLLRRRFTGFDVGGIVTWHGGAHAPDRIFCLHSIGDVAAGIFGQADPRAGLALLRALDASRVAHGLHTWQVLVEATHWSGILAGYEPSAVLAYPIPLVDIEVGSSLRCWEEPAAVAAVADALWHVFDGVQPFASVLFVGGSHFELAYGALALRERCGVSHVLSTRWLEQGAYADDAGATRLIECARTVRGGVDLVVYNGGLKGPYKRAARQAAARLGIAAISHRQPLSAVGALA